MTLFDVFRQQIIDKKWWSNQDKVLIAVSGGVDSMVLLDLMLKLEESVRPTILVAHVNHQLREVSNHEEVYLKKWCDSRHIPFLSSTWEEGPHIERNLELEARKFRYEFFEKIMIQEEVSVLLTGHHKNDQVETILMRLISGNRLNYLVGIEEKRDFCEGNLIRPLLLFEKKELYNYAMLENLSFFEDETNQEGTYLRNRLRNQIIPLLKEENPRFEEQLLDSKRELQLGLELIEKSIADNYNKSISFEEDYSFIRRSIFVNLSEAEQHFILNRWVSELQNHFQLVVTKRQQEAIAQLLVSQNPNQSLTLKEDWQVVRSYDQVVIRKNNLAPISHENYELSLNQGIYVSDTEWFGLFEANAVQIPEEIKDWSQKELIIMPDSIYPLVIRKRLPGDKLILNKKGQTKKIRRYFIDEKIPHEDREKSWIVSDIRGEIKWLVPFRESYLSIRDETDKIHYKLVYLNKKDR